MPLIRLMDILIGWNDMTQQKKCWGVHRTLWVVVGALSAACAPVPRAQGAQEVPALQRIGREDDGRPLGVNARRETVRYLDQPWVFLKAMDHALPTQAAPPPTPAPQRWEVRISDGTLSRALTRWADEAGLQLVWDAPLDKPALRASYEGSFDTAVETLMIDSKATGYQLHACAYANAIRILHVSQVCKR
jgi:hypothetical protein